MEQQELLIAAAVREIAIDIRRRGAGVASRSGNRIEGETFDSFHTRFAASHPLTEYAKEALAELEAIGQAMRG